MKKYRLYSEHQNVSIYGDNPRDALKRLGMLPMSSHQEGDKMYGDKPIRNMVTTPALEISRIIGIDDTKATRGSDKIITVIVETSESKILGVDLHEENVTINEG